MVRGLGAIFYKELRHVVRDPATIVLAIAIPLIQLTIFGYAIDTDVRDIPTAILDLSGTRRSREFVSALENTGYFRVVEETRAIEELRGSLRAARARVGVVIERDFADHPLSGQRPRVQVLLDGSDPTVSNQAQHVVLLLSSQGTRQPVDLRPRVLFNEEGRSEVFYVPGLAAVIFQLVLTMLTAFAVVKERESGTLEQLVVTPISRTGLMAGKLLPFAGIGAVAAVVVYGAMVVVFRVPIRGNLATLGGLTVVFLFTSLALGLVVSTLARTQLHAMLVSMGIMLPSILLSGFAFPRESMPDPIYVLGFALPATYFVSILRGVVLRGATFVDVLPQSIPLAAIGVGLFALGVARFRKRLD
ncbi:MAG: ABC transporter permease [Planctomycetes bacterium]|nr:ABC transporter permease [Planctomycetota bacterium]